MSVILPLIGGNLGGAWTPPIEQSLIFDGAAYQSWTPGVASTSRRIGSLAMWYRRAEFGVNDRLFSSRLDSSNYLLVEFQSDNTMRVNITISGTSYIWVTNAVYRDIGWQHMLMTWNTTTQTFALLHNGVARTFSSSATLPLNGDTAIFHNGARQTLGAWYDGVGHSEIFHGAIADVHGVDGTALANADAFLDGVTFDGQSLPAPKRVSGLTYGTNGFHLAFADSAAFGDDTSGNTNDWTPTGFVAGDQTADVPGRPYPRWNPLDAQLPARVGDGGRSLSSTTNENTRATLAASSGKFYWEATGGGHVVGIQTVNTAISNLAGSIGYFTDGQKYINGIGSAYGATWTSSDVIGVAVDFDALQVTFYKNNVSQGAISFSAGEYAPWDRSSSGTMAYRFEEAAWTYTPPTGFLPLHTGNLPTPTADGRNYFAVNTRTGTGATYSVTNGPANGTDLVWTKGRSGATDHALYDILRGVQKQLESNTTTAETTETTGLTAFNATGYTAGALAQMNTSAATYVDWMWKAGGAGVANTDGTISSTVSVAAPGHFSIVAWEGNATAGATIGHGLGGVPEMIIAKNRETPSSSTADWPVYHKNQSATPTNAYLLLNSTAAVAAGTTAWNNGTFTSSVFTVGSHPFINDNTKDFIAYCFRSIPGLCKVGSYTGNGSADGPLIDLGFTARWIMIKSATQSSSPWYIYDTARQTTNVMSEDLLANSSAAEPGSGGGAAIDILSSAVKHRSNRLYLNNSGSTYIYLALAELAGGGDLPWPLAR